MRFLLTALLIFLLADSAVLTAAGPERHALFIAVSEFENDDINLPELHFPESDARQIGELLSWAGYKLELLRGRAATQNAIREKLDDLVHLGNSNGVVVVGLFGHGIDIETRNENGLVTIEPCFCPYDATLRIAKDVQGRGLRGEQNQTASELDPDSLICLSEVMKALNETKSGHRVVFADCNHMIPNRSLGHTFGSNFSTAKLPQNTALFFGSSAHEQSFEFETWGHGAFTKCVLQGMQDLYANGNVTTRSIADRLKRDVPQLVASVAEGKHQTPRYYANASIDLQFVKMSMRHAFVGKSAGDERELVPGMKFHWCPLGSFAMGSPGSETGRHQNETQTDVSLTGFWMGETEVTQTQWKTIMKSAPWQKAQPWQGKTHVKEGADHAANYISHGDFGDGRIEPDSATEFCRRLTEREREAGRLPVGWKYGLPTEAQWEYACRAGTKTKFSFGDDEKRLSEYGWWGAKYGFGNALPEQYANRVALKKENPWGLYDMHGNVWEWCADWYQDKVPGGMDPVVLARGSRRVCRGGCWILNPSSCRSAIRSGGSPDNRNSLMGFRVAAYPSRD